MTCDNLSFRVIGTPAPKGSWRAFVRGKRAVLVADNRKTLPWCDAVTDAAHVAMGNRAAFHGVPLKVILIFFAKRPKGHFTKRGELRRNAPLRPWRKPDLDKLARSTLDALTGVVFDDDARVVSLQCDKWFVDRDEQPGAMIGVTPA
jgi:Holliday junction resolvase RusA-like endonuclease